MIEIIEQEYLIPAFRLEGIEDAIAVLKINLHIPGVDCGNC